MIRFRVGFPAAAFTVVIPAVNGVAAVIQLPTGTDLTKGDSRGGVVENVIASGLSMVIVDNCIAGQCQVGSCTTVIDTAAVAGGTLIVVVARDGQVNAFLEDNLAVVG